MPETFEELPLAEDRAPQEYKYEFYPKLLIRMWILENVKDKKSSCAAIFKCGGERHATITPALYKLYKLYLYNWPPLNMSQWCGDAMPMRSQPGPRP